MLKFLELFYSCTVSLSGVHYPTPPLMMHFLLAIGEHLSQFENDDKLHHVVYPMKAKFIKYWGTIPLLYSYAFILDSRAKFTGFSNALQLLSQALHRDYTDYYNKAKTELSNFFTKYESKYGSVRM